MSKCVGLGVFAPGGCQCSSCRTETSAPSASTLHAPAENLHIRDLPNGGTESPSDSSGAVTAKPLGVNGDTADDGGNTPGHVESQIKWLEKVAAKKNGTDPGYLEVHGELLDLHVRKSSTYGNDGERFHNFVALGQAAGKPPEYGAWMRIVEKGVRALNMIDAGQQDDVKEGPDVAGLAIIAEALRRRRGNRCNPSAE